MVMNTTRASIGIAYELGYAKGRHAAKEHRPAAENPFPWNSSAYQGWADGHYDELSARYVAIERHSAFVWGEPHAA